MLRFSIALKNLSENLSNNLHLEERPLLSALTPKALQEKLEKTLAVRMPFYRQAKITLENEFTVDYILKTLKLPPQGY